MDLLKLTEFIVKSIVKDENDISIKQYEDDEFVTIEILVATDVIGTIIGKSGNIANSIRTIVQASSYANGLKKVKINIDSF